MKKITIEALIEMDSKELDSNIMITKEDLRFICTRFAHKCRLNGVVTNDETIKLFDKIIDDILEKI